MKMTQRARKIKLFRLSKMILLFLKMPFNLVTVR